MAAPQHRISISVGGKQVEGWTEYEIASSMLDAVDHFTLSRPFDPSVYRICTLDSKVIVRIDDVAMIEGFVDEREKESDKGASSMTISGRDKVGRLVQESAESISYDGIDLLEAVTRLAHPWFTSVVLSDARNRTLRLGKRGRKAAAGNEAIIVKVRKKTWQVEPGQARWKIINDLCSEAGYMVWSSADGKELIIGQPNYTQGVQFLIANPATGSSLSSTCLSLGFKESVADRYSLIMALGSGRGDAANYGESTVSRRDIVRNGPGIDGTGLDFDFPKRLILAERTLLNLDEAKQYAQRDMDRRDFSKQIVTAVMPGHGQVVGGATAATLFAPNTISRVIDEEQDLPVDGSYLIYSCKFSGARDTETTELQLVPRGTVFAQ